jgi:hypothetical protein
MENRVANIRDVNALPSTTGTNNHLPTPIKCTCMMGTNCTGAPNAARTKKENGFAPVYLLNTKTPFRGNTNMSNL